MKWSRRGFLKFIGISPALEGIAPKIADAKHIPEVPIEDHVINYKSDADVHPFGGLKSTRIYIDEMDFSDLCRNIEIISSVSQKETVRAELFADSRLLSIENMNEHKIEICMMASPVIRYLFRAKWKNYSIRSEMDSGLMVFVEMETTSPIEQR